MKIIHTDGACSRNPGGCGGWGWHSNCGLYDSGHIISPTTNNRAELQSILEAMKMFPTEDLIFYSDSTYAVNCGNGDWKRKLNLDLWKEFDELEKGRSIKLKWISRDDNERADELAKKACKDSTVKSILSQNISKIETYLIDY